MSIRPSSSSSIAVPVGHTLGSTLFSFAKSRLPVPNKPKTRTHRTFLSAAPVPFAPLVDTHVFQPPPPPYSAHANESADEFLPVPHNTPVASSTRSHFQSQNAFTASHDPPLGLGLEGVEKGDGCRFDGLGRLSGGFRGAGDALREEVHRMLSAQRRRTRANERPAMQHDVFYASMGVKTRRTTGVPVKIRIRRRSVASPTPVSRRWEGVMRGTISSELKRAASLERRASLGETTRGWRV